MTRYHIYTDARHPNGDLAAGSLLSIYGDSDMTALITLYADEITGTTLENPYTVPITGICNFWVDDLTPWVLSENDTTPKPIYVNISAGDGAVNVKDFGAVGDGTTDDTVAIQAAIDSCGTGGGIVYFPPGATYCVQYATDYLGALKFPSGNTNWLIFSGYGATLKYGTTTINHGIYMSRAIFGIDVERDAVGPSQTFRKLLFQGFTFDFNNGLGTYGIKCQNFGLHQRLRYEDIIVRDIHGTNASAATGTACKIFSCHVINRLAEQNTEKWAERIHVENCTMSGGFGLAAVTGSSEVPPAVAGITPGANAEVTMSAYIGYAVGESVEIGGQTGTTPDINGTHVVTALTGTYTFEIDFEVTADLGNNDGTIGTMDQSLAWYDKITYRDCWHDSTITDYSAMQAQVSYFIGSGLPGGDAVIDNCYGAGSGDIGFEIDNASSAVISNCKAENCANGAFLFVNFADHLYGSQSWTLRDSSYRVTGTGFESCQNMLLALYAPSVHKMDSVLVEGCSLYKYGSGISGYPAFLLAAPNNAGNGLYLDGRVTVRDCDLIIEADGTTPTEALASTPLLLDIEGTNAEVVLENIRIKISGNAQVAGPQDVTVVKAGGSDWRLTADNIDVDLDIVGLDTFSFLTPTVDGFSSDIRNVRFHSIDHASTAVGLTVPAFATYPFEKRGVVFRDCDFTNLTAVADTPTNQTAGLVRSIDCKWPTAAGDTPIAVGASAYTYTNVTLFPQYVFVTGGTVSVIKVNACVGGSFATTGVVSGSWILKPGAKIEVTYSSVPTMSYLPILP